MKAVRFAFALAAALLAAACLPVTTKGPVGTTVGFKPDPALVGVWKGHSVDDGKETGYLAFLANDDDTMTALVISPGKTTGEWESYSLRTATLGTNRFINAREEMKNGKTEEDDQTASLDIVLLYRFQKNGKLALYMIDEAAAKAAIKAGKIPGTIDSGDFGDAHITAEPAALDALMQSKDGLALFTKPLLVLSKVN
jgi:hypothetical protein